MTVDGDLEAAGLPIVSAAWVVTAAEAEVHGPPRRDAGVVVGLLVRIAPEGRAQPSELEAERISRGLRVGGGPAGGDRVDGRARQMPAALAGARDRRDRHLEVRALPGARGSERERVDVDAHTVERHLPAAASAEGEGRPANHNL